MRTLTKSELCTLIQYLFLLSEAMPDHEHEKWKTIGVRVKESDLTNLNLELKRLGYSSLREPADAVIAGSFHTQISEIARVLAEEFVNIVKRDLLTFAP